MMFGQMILAIKAIKARQVEDQAEAATWTTRKAELQVLMQNRYGRNSRRKSRISSRFSA